jgi:hypothetical protein
MTTTTRLDPRESQHPSPVTSKVKHKLPSLHAKIRAYHGAMAGEHHRYRSWEHCFGYFQSTTPQKLKQDPRPAALHLGFYLASWGMYRGSGFLLQHAYTIHLDVVRLLASSTFDPLWKTEFGADQDDSGLAPAVLTAASAVRNSYHPFASSAEAGDATDTLVTKILLGTLGCLPACDRFFIDGFKAAGLSYSRLNSNFINRLLEFTHANLTALRTEQSRIESHTGVRYPLMKLVDMYFWQLGYERDNASA